MPLAKVADIYRDSYHIQQSRGRRQEPHERNPRRFQYSYLTTWALWCLYVVFQLKFLYSVQHEASDFLWRAWVAALIEVCLTISEFDFALNVALTLFCAPKRRARPRYKLIGSSGAAPTIDVFITCCNEPINIIIDTLAAAAAQEYPSHRFRVAVLDDGHDEKLREAVDTLSKALGQCGPKILYLSRRLNPGELSHFKAGNLQYGINETKRLGGSEFLASLDADMIVQPDWLAKLIPHLLLHDELALAIPPQCYYNIPDKDPFGQQAEFDFFFSIFEPLKDRVGATMCTGTGFVVRRSAIDEIGNWPLADTGEDYMCSITLSNAGWKIAFIQEDLQIGLGPDSLRSHVKQRMRWTDAGIEVHKALGFYLPPWRILKLTWPERIIGFLMAVRDFCPLLNVVALFVLPIALFPTESDEFRMINSQYDRTLLRVLFLAVRVSHKTNDIIVYGHVGVQRVINFQANDIWVAPYNAIRCIYSLLPSGTVKFAFEPTGTMVSKANERSAIRRTPLPYRLFSPDLAMYALYIIYASVPLALRIVAYTSIPSSARFFPFPGVIIKLLDCIMKMSVPIRYMLFPPTVPDREELLQVDSKGLRRPKRKGGNQHVERVLGDWFSWMDLAELCVIWYCDWR